MRTFPQVRVVGMHFRGGSAKDVAAALDPGDTVTLEREPDNEYDAYAIKVLVSDMHIGYIERNMAAWISPLIDQGWSAVGIVTGHEQRKNNLHPLLDVKCEESANAEG
jgi:hypothetical protein